jgi:hypothetical protein
VVHKMHGDTRYWKNMADWYDFIWGRCYESVSAVIYG